MARKQLGVGEGTTEKKRRTPNQAERPVHVTEASGGSLGVDGFPHPLETNEFGELKVTTRDLLEVLERIADGIERVEDQLALINEGENLKPGERHYG